MVLFDISVENTLPRNRLQMLIGKVCSCREEDLGRGDEFRKWYDTTFAETIGFTFVVATRFDRLKKAALGLNNFATSIMIIVKLAKILIT